MPIGMCGIINVSWIVLKCEKRISDNRFHIYCVFECRKIILLLQKKMKSLYGYVFSNLIFEF